MGTLSNPKESNVLYLGLRGICPPIIGRGREWFRR
jgi:hypothetical protein